MSTNPHDEPECKQATQPDIELHIAARARDLGDGFTVQRILPAVGRRMVGPFIFVDLMGPMQLPDERGMDVRPHPHINLATVTYLFEGEILHRDSLGSEQPIRPGAVNWMTAGRGIVHSERSPAAARKSGVRLHGLQLWVALPQAHEETAPAFLHCPADTIPTVEQPGARLRIVAGSAYGATSPAQVLSPLFYVEAQLERGATLQLPEPEQYAQRAAYVIDGAVEVGGEPQRQNHMMVFREGRKAAITALEPARVMLLGGAPLDGERHIYWNFISSSQARIEAAKADWQARRFPTVPGDETEFIPLPTL
jgi:redox-sensitive bicupin YhaK (pirin superfamily)